MSFKNQVSIKSRIYAEVTLRPAPSCEGAACERCREGKFTQLSGELQKERGKFQSRQLSLLTHFNLGKPDVRLPTRDFVGRCKGWSVLETDVSPPPLLAAAAVPLSVIWMPSTSRAAFITELLYLGFRLDWNSTPRHAVKALS